MSPVLRIFLTSRAAENKKIRQILDKQPGSTWLKSSVVEFNAPTEVVLQGWNSLSGELKSVISGTKNVAVLWLDPRWPVTKIRTTQSFDGRAHTQQANGFDLEEIDGEFCASQTRNDIKDDIWGLMKALGPDASDNRDDRSFDRPRRYAPLIMPSSAAPVDALPPLLFHIIFDEPTSNHSLLELHAATDGDIVRRPGERMIMARLRHDPYSGDTILPAAMAAALTGTPYKVIARLCPGWAHSVIEKTDRDGKHERRHGIMFEDAMFEDGEGVVDMGPGGNFYRGLVYGTAQDVGLDGRNRTWPYPE